MESQCPPESSLQLQDSSRNAPPSPRRMMTLADLDQKDILADTPDPEYTYNIEIRAFVLTNEF